jgi:hypothetical protein
MVVVQVQGGLAFSRLLPISRLQCLLPAVPCWFGPAYPFLIIVCLTDAKRGAGCMQSAGGAERQGCIDQVPVRVPACGELLEHRRGRVGVAGVSVGHRWGWVSPPGCGQMNAAQVSFQYFPGPLRLLRALP